MNKAEKKGVLILYNKCRLHATRFNLELQQICFLISYELLYYEMSRCLFCQRVKMPHEKCKNF